MPRNQTSLLLHPFFLLNLFILVANDHWWKQAYSNVLTGKISDFAGVFVMAVFLVACCRFNRKHAVIFTALFFAWWKSPLSEPFITTLGLARVVDYSDLAALIILPVVLYMKPFHYNRSRPRYAAPFIAVITWTAMVATTLPYRFGGYGYPEGYVSVDKRWVTKLTVQQFFHKLDSLHIPWKQDSLVYMPANPYRLMMAVKTGPDSVYRMTPVNNLKDTLLYYEKDMGPHYIIPFVALEKDTITDIRFRIYDNGKRRVLELIEMNIPPDMAAQYIYTRQVRKKYRDLVKSFMLE